MADSKKDSASLQRMMLIKNIEPYLKRLKGKLLDIGGAYAPFKDKITVDKYVIIDISAKFKPDIVGDVHDMHMIKDKSFDAILATELLEHCHTPQDVINEFHRVLTKDGVVLLSVPYLFPYHPDPHDYYRYTVDGLEHLFRNFHSVKIINYGGRLPFFWEMTTWVLPFLKVFNRLLSKINWKDTNCPSGFIVYARK